MGSTIRMNVAIECTSKNHPWEPGQVVVGLSRTESCDKIYIVYDDTKLDAIKRLWTTLCITTQWTAMSDDIIDNLSVTAPCNGGHERATDKNILDIGKSFPWRICDYPLPTSGGVVYMIVSTKNPEYTVVGQSQFGLSRRLGEHQSKLNRGNSYTNFEAYRPYTPAAYICRLQDMDQSGRERLEKKWQGLNEQSRAEGRGDLLTCMRNGEKVVEDFNTEYVSDPSKQIILVRLLQPKAFDALDEMELDMNT
jgi:hypothetical protein